MPVAKGSSVPAWPTLILEASCPTEALGDGSADELACCV